ELLLDQEVRERARDLAEEHRANPTLAELLDSLAEGIPRDGMEALTSVLQPEEMATLPVLMPAGTRVVVCDPDKVRRRAADLAQAGREFLEASWTAATMGGDAPVDSETLDLSGSGYRTFSSVPEDATEAGRPWWQLVPPGFLVDDEDGAVVDVPAGDPPAPRGRDAEMAAMFTRLRGVLAGGGRAAIVVPGHGTVARILERLSEAEVPARAAEPDRARLRRRGGVRGRAPRGFRPRGRRPGGARPARDRQVRRDGRAAGPRRGRLVTARVRGDRVRARQARRRRRPAVRAHGVARPAQPVRRRRGAVAEQDGRRRLAEHQAQGPQGRPRDRHRARPALRQAP